MQDHNVIELEAKLRNIEQELKIAKGALRKVYTVGYEANNVAAGHGDYYNETQIRPMGMYGCDGLPPVFATKELAEIYLNNMKYKSGYVVVELGFIE